MPFVDVDSLSGIAHRSLKLLNDSILQSEIFVEYCAFSRGPPAPKILAALLAVRISPFQFSQVRETRAHLQELWQRDAPETRFATSRQIWVRFGRNSNGPQKLWVIGEFLGVWN